MQNLIRIFKQLLVEKKHTRNKVIQLPKASVPEPGKYNPNYSAVYKYIPSFVMKTHENQNTFKDKIKKDEEERVKKLSEKLEEKKKRKETLLTETRDTNVNNTVDQTSSRKNTFTVDYMTSLATENSDTSRIYQTNPSVMLPFLTLSSNNQSPKSKIKGIMFEKYSARKDIFKPSDISVLTYLEPHNLVNDKKTGRL